MKTQHIELKRNGHIGFTLDLLTPSGRWWDVAHKGSFLSKREADDEAARLADLYRCEIIDQTSNENQY